jgi:Zn-dependent peptidase ImmA (M78 family)
LYIYTILEDYIKNLYYSVSITTPAEIDISIIAERLGVSIWYSSNLNFIYEETIVLTRTNSRKQWQSFGHELCHYLIHDGNQYQLPQEFIDYQENKARNFMYDFCVPTFMLEKLSLPQSRSETIAMIAETFNVEETFAEERLNYWLSQVESQRFYRQLSEAHSKGF